MWIKRNRHAIPATTSRAAKSRRATCSRTAGACCGRSGAVARDGLVGVNGEALATLTSPDAKAQKLAAKTNPKFVVARQGRRRSRTSRPTTTSTSSAPTRAIRRRTRHAASAAVEGVGRRRDQEPEGLRHRRNPEARAARRARVPAALRRRLVDGDSVDRRFAVGADQARASRPATRSTCSSSRWPIRRRCRACRRRFSTGRIPKACAWTRR